MLWVIHVDEGFEAITRPEIREKHLFDFPWHEHRSRVVDEKLIILADVLDVFVARNHPEGLVVGMVAIRYGALIAQLAQERMHSVFVTHHRGVDEIMDRVHDGTLD